MTMATGEISDIKYSQLKATIKDLFDFITLKNPVTDYKSIGILLKSLKGHQCLNTSVEITTKSPLDALQAIRNGLNVAPKTMVVLKTWLNGTRANYVPKLLKKENIEGVKTLLERFPRKIDDTDAVQWLKCFFKTPHPNFDKEQKYAKNTSLLASVYTACKDEVILSVENMENWEDLKEGLKRYMINEKIKCKPKEFVTECDITVPNWEDYVRNDEIFNLHAPLCLPFLTKMLDINIIVFQYPAKEEVTFFCDTASASVTIELCFIGDKFVPIVPIDLDNIALEKQRSLKEKIIRLESRIKILEAKLELLTEDNEQERRKLERELNETKEKVTKYKEKLKKSEERKKKEMDEAALQIVDMLFNKYIKHETGSDYECPS